ncbi:hypothetical protein ACWC9R_07265 [Streptomyces sp. NPDC001219]
MSRTELERLARIRMQVTGETLERAMAVLESHTARTTPQPGPASQPHSAEISGGEEGEQETSQAENDRGDEAGTVSELGATGEESAADSAQAPKPDAPRSPRRRGHLRGL